MFLPIITLPYCTHDAVTHNPQLLSSRRPWRSSPTCCRGFETSLISTAFAVLRSSSVSGPKDKPAADDSGKERLDQKGCIGSRWGSGSAPTTEWVNGFTEA